VKQNETLSQIARKYGVSRADIATANNITDPRTIHAGQELIIPSPKNGKAAPATATTEQPPAQPEPTINQPVINTAPTSPISSPISAPTEASPISPAASETTPPVIKVEETNPIAPPKS
jgi:LysM repeat protein